MTSRPPSSKRPWLAAALQLVCVVGGLGYAYLGQYRRFGAVLAVVLALHAVNFVCAENEWKVVSMFLGPSIWIVQVLSALDAWRQARGEAVG